jgi:hypothetical protein
MGEILTDHVGTNDNWSDFMTKGTYGQKRCHLVGSVLHNIYDDFHTKKCKDKTYYRESTKETQTIESGH